MHSFIGSFNRAYEGRIDKFLIKEGYAPEAVSMEFQRRGIDRYLTIGNERVPVEYKAETRVTDTGNYFLETISVDKDNKPGWVEYSEALYIIYYLPLEHKLFFVLLSDIKDNMAKWKELYPEKICRNKTYNSLGIIVPRDKIEYYKIKEINISG